MPLLSLKTNINIDDKQNLASSMSAKVAELLHKPERYVMVSLEDQLNMTFAGNDAPLMYMELKSINLPQSETAQISTALCELINQQTAIPQDRIYIEFSNAERHMWGWNGATF